MTNNRTLHCFTNGADKVIAYDSDDAAKALIETYGGADMATGNFRQIHDNEVFGVRGEDGEPMVFKTAREWSVEGRGLLCTTEA